MATVREEYWVTLQGRKYPTYPGVLVAAHEEGLLGIEVTVLQYPSADNGDTAVCSATVTMRGSGERELIFTEIGDASPKNVSPAIGKHLIRMAATRSKGRALRDAIALGVTLLEELGDEDDSPQPPRHSPGNGASPVAQRRAAHDPQDHAERAAASEAPSAMCEQCGTPVLPDTATAARKRWGVVLCLEDGKARIHADKAAANGTPAQLQGA